VSTKKNLYSYSYCGRCRIQFNLENGCTMSKPAALDTKLSTVSLSGDIPGVFTATQKRSVRIRDSFINVGVEALNDTRLRDLTVAQLCQRSGNSVGAFYTRFKDKDAYFRALRGYAIDSHNLEARAKFNIESLARCDTTQTLERLVDVMVDIFTGRFRGVLRESLLLILEPDDPWAPMRDAAQKVVATLQASLVDAFPDKTPAETNVQCRFCFQIIVGTLQNDLINDYHVFTTKDDSLRNGLKKAVCAYMGLAK